MSCPPRGSTSRLAHLELVGLGVPQTLTLRLEDSFAGVTAGVAGGFITVMVPDLHQPTDEIRSLATRVCASLHEVRELLQAQEL